MSEAEAEEFKARVKKAALDLGEYADSVQIFISVNAGETSSTISYEFGTGSFYARYGQIAEWMTMQEQFQRNEAIRRDAKRDDEDGDK